MNIKKRKVIIVNKTRETKERTKEKTKKKKSPRQMRRAKRSLQASQRTARTAAVIPERAAAAAKPTGKRVTTALQKRPRKIAPKRPMVATSRVVLHQAAL